MMSWIGRAAMFAFGALALCACSTPRNDRTWDPYLSHTTHVELNSAHFAVTPVTDWTYDAQAAVTRGHIDATYDIADVQHIWFVLEPQPGMSYAAHTFLLFEFPHDRLLGVTIEARRELGEEYSALRGAFNAYELAYVWGTARDLLTRRAVLLNHEVFMYPTTPSENMRRAILTHLLQGTEALETHPRFYNTLTSNCTNELAKATKLRWHYSFVATGYSDDHLYKLGFIPGPTFDEAHRRADISTFVRELNLHGGETDAAFDHALLTELRRRSASDQTAALGSR